MPMPTIEDLRDPIVHLWHVGECPRCGDILEEEGEKGIKSCMNGTCAFLYIKRIEKDDKVKFVLCYMNKQELG